ncbi:RNA polymerase sigma factor [Hymenobacter qilianensis]|uniref:RNA polymerase sigma factor n=2 Tax=Hymenobacter qilianensis TaxID=1385715 RepID=A0A7H0GWY0_9BACT|nr:RNA polymerase sigma factor [Hymenobacter qilianensis]QNP52796.1 RNA polymerase sigma factor [Hymenobacter qilianensis]
METRSDEELMAAVQADDLDQVVPLFERYQGPLFNFLYRLTSDYETSQDLTQTVFERLLKYRASYRPGQPFRAWAYQLARNVHTDHWQRNQKMRTTDVVEVERKGALGGAAFRHTAAVDREQDLHEAMALLPPAQHEILVLHRFQGFSYEEIADMLGCTAGAAKVKAHRALQALRTIYFN